MESKKVESNAELTPFEKEFKVQLNLPAAYFSVFYAIYVGYMIISGNFNDLPAVVALGVVAIGYLFGYRPYKYVVKRRTLEIHRRIGKTKEINFSKNYTIEKNATSNSVSYSAKNVLAKKREELTPSFTTVFPIVYFALEKFQLENVSGSASNWKEFGKWYYNSLLSDTEEIPEATQQKVKSLIGDEKNPIKIALGPTEKLN